jgi:cytoskeletal protein RodZ
MSPLAFDQEQAQKLTEIGTHLRNIRTQKGISLDDIATKTMIQSRFLSAIEKGQLEQLPEAVYIRGFIRRFAEAMGVDGKSLAETFPLGRDQPVSSSSRLLGSSPTVLRPWHLYLAYLLAIIAAVTALYFLFKPQAPSSNSATKVPAKATTKASSVPKGTTLPANKPKPPSAPVLAQLKLKADSYLEITADGKSTYTGTLKAGTARTVTAQKEINIFSGNPGGVVLQVNNQPGKVMGQVGQPKEITLTPNSKQP